MTDESGAAVLDHAAATDTTSQATDHGTSDASAVSTPARPDAASGATTDASAETTVDELVSSGLLDAETYAASKDDPAALKRNILKGWTQKTQQLASDRRELATWANIRDAYADDPHGTLRALAAQAGLEILDPRGQRQQQTTQAAASDAAAKLAQKMAELGFGEDVGHALAPIFREMAQEVAGKVTEPIRSHQEQLIQESAAREQESALLAFKEKYPDWESGNDLDQRMASIAKRIDLKDPKSGQPVSPMEFLETCYFLANRESVVASEVQKAIDRMTQSAQAAQPRTTGVRDKSVSKTAPANASLTDAYEAAKRGVRWE